jgi:hypothetical protein
MTGSPASATGDSRGDSFLEIALNMPRPASAEASGAFVDVDGERYYAIHNVDRMAPFFVSVISASDHWLFVSSAGGLSAGRVSPDTALFPYVTVDKIHDASLNTGPRTFVRVTGSGEAQYWEPFNAQHDTLWAIERHLYKNVLGNKLCFAEVNHDLGLEFRYTWSTSDEFGFVRHAELLNHGSEAVSIDMLDGLQNLLPAGTPRFTQTNSSNLVDAYKWTELDEASGLALYTLYSGITDRAEPSESLKANVAYSLGIDAPTILLSSEQLDRFRRGDDVQTEVHRRGIRGAFFVSTTMTLAANASAAWQIVTDIELGQADAVALRQRLANPAALSTAVSQSIDAGSVELAAIMAKCDGFQVTACEEVDIRHYANVLFNVLRGGYFPDQYNVSLRDFKRTIRVFNRPVYERRAGLFDTLPETLEYAELAERIAATGDAQLVRLAREYLPITFGRRHGDPSRPWNNFAIRLKDRYGQPLLSYEGNWRDIFQNWEALALSFPGFVENMIAKFVNASTMDGYNPYRVTKEGIDWEVEDPEDPWSYIGYWGDHQIIYLAKLLELSRDYHPGQLEALLDQRIFAYANVPYRLRPFDATLADPKHTVDYDEAAAAKIERLESEIGNDARLVLDSGNSVVQVNLLEKLLVPLLSKLGNFVIDGGIWMNTQRPEWNDANNALVGQGLSMVTLCYLRRYVRFLEDLLASAEEHVELSSEVATWLRDSAAVLDRFRPLFSAAASTAAERQALLEALGETASAYRQRVYAQGGFSGSEAVDSGTIRALLADLLVAIDQTIDRNRRDDGLYHAYNLLDQGADGISIDTLYPMLEGQVAALSTLALDPGVAAEVIESLFASPVYRADQDSFMLYPDRELPAFLEKNRLPADAVEGDPLLRQLLDDGNEQIVVRDVDGNYRFSAGFANAADLDHELDALRGGYGDSVDAARERLRALFESTFDHQSFTGRSGTMFGFEGLGCIYWHMVSKLLLAVQENFVQGAEAGIDEDTLARLGSLYYRVRDGLSFNKTPADYGAFPTDPYSHTPGHSGAQQPGMTGQVKEEILTRFGELGVRVRGGQVHYVPNLLRRNEFNNTARGFCWLDVKDQWQDVELPSNSLAFTLCQVPVLYALDETGASSTTIHYTDGTEATVDGLSLSSEDSASLFGRTGQIRLIRVRFGPDRLFGA